MYYHNLSFAELDKTGGKVLPQLVGINKATTFTGFCSYHDNEVFKPIETQPFTATQKQCGLLGFRAVAKEYYTKKAEMDSLPVLADADKGLPYQEQVSFQNFIRLYGEQVSAGIRDIKIELDQYAECLLQDDYSRIKYFGFLTERTPEIMCCGGMSPEIFFTGDMGDKLLDPLYKFHFIGFNILATETGGAIIFSWVKSDNLICERVIEEFQKIDLAKLPDAIIPFVYEMFENVASAPKWWDSLATNAQRLMIELIQHGISQHKTENVDLFGYACENLSNWGTVRSISNL